MLTLRTDRGVFSHGRLDPGTAMLLRTAPSSAARGHAARPRLRQRRDRPDAGPTAAPRGDGVGDRRQRAGAGADARRTPPPTAWPTSLVAAPDEVPADVRFDVIWSNPPIRIGKPALHELLTTWLRPPRDRRPGRARRAPPPRRRLAAALADRPGLADDPPGVARATASSHPPEYPTCCRGSGASRSNPRCGNLGWGGQRRAGSTSMRRRLPFGRGAAMSAWPSSSHVGARTRSTSPWPPPTATPATSRSASATSSPPGPLTAASAANGGSDSSRRRSVSGPTSRPGSASRAAPAPPRGAAGTSAPAAARRRSRGPDQPGAAHEQRHRLLGGAVARRQQLGVDVEEGDDVGARARGAARPRCRRRRPAGRRVVGVGAGDGDDRAARRPPPAPRAAA